MRVIRDGIRYNNCCTLSGVLFLDCQLFTASPNRQSAPRHRRKVTARLSGAFFNRLAGVRQRFEPYSQIIRQDDRTPPVLLGLEITAADRLAKGGQPDPGEGACLLG
jgi:hypothetical protein